MKRFMDRYCLRIAINSGCFIFMLLPATREHALIAVTFVLGLAVEPWIRVFETRHEGMETQMDAMTEAVRFEQAQANSNLK